MATTNLWKTKYTTFLNIIVPLSLSPVHAFLNMICSRVSNEPPIRHEILVHKKKAFRKALIIFTLNTCEYVFKSIWEIKSPFESKQIVDFWNYGRKIFSDEGNKASRPKPQSNSILFPLNKFAANRYIAMSSLSVPHCMAANNKSPKSLGQDKSEKFIRRTRLKFSFVNYHGRFSTLFKNTLSSDFPAHYNLFNSVLTMLHGTQYNQKPREKLSQHPNIRVDRFLTRGGWFIETDNKTQGTSWEK